MYEEKNVYLKLTTKKGLSPQHLNKGKLHLNKNGSKLLSNNFIGEISEVFNGQSEWGNLNAIRNKLKFLAEQVNLLTTNVSII